MRTGRILDNYIRIYMNELPEEQREELLDHELVMFTDSVLFDNILEDEGIVFNSDSLLSPDVDILKVNDLRVDESTQDSYDYYRSGESVHVVKNKLNVRIVRVGSRPSIIQMKLVKR